MWWNKMKMKLNSIEAVMIKNNMKRRDDIELNIDLDSFYLSVIPESSLEIACDYILLNLHEAKEYNFNGYFELCPEEWWVFAETGTGDCWAMRVGTSNEIAFFDHNKGSNAEPRLLFINFEQWMQLADLSNQFDGLDGDTFSASKEFYKKLDTISRGLSKIYPYSVY